MASLSAIVATCNRKVELKKLLESFLRNNIENLEIIIIDQNQDNLIDALVAQYKSRLNINHVKYHIKHHSIARNYGVSLAKNDLICFPDDDCWFDKDALREIVDFYSQNLDIDMLIARWKQNPAFRLKSQALTQEMIFSFKTPVAFNSNTLFFKRESFNSVKGFDETFGIGGYIGAADETDLIFRMAVSKNKIFYNHTLTINHPYRRTHNLSPSNLRRRERGTGLLYSKFKLSPYVIVRGFLSPIAGILSNWNLKSVRRHSAVLIGRWEGFIYKR